MSDEQDKLKLSLEPPKLFGRKKKSDATGTDKGTPEASEPSAPADSEPDSEPGTASAEVPVEEPAAEVVEEPAAEVAPEPEPAAEVAPEPEPEPAAEVTPEPEPEQPAATTVPAKKPAPAKKAAAPAAKAAPAKKATPAKKVTPAAKPAAAETSTVPAPAAKATETAAKRPARPRAKLAPEIEPEPITATHHDHDDDIDLSDVDEGPLLPLYPAAAVTGALVGATMVVLTWLSLRGCEAVRGTASCGGGPGFLLLIATFVVCILLGGALLKVFQIPDPGSTSFLGVGLVAVLSLLFLIDALDHWSMLIVIPVISVGAFLASVWVTKTFVEPGDT